MSADSLETLGNLTGLSRATMLELAAMVKANHATLSSCPWHDFEQDPESPASTLRQRYRCKHCGGTIDAHAYHWHEQGRRTLD